jgi:pimeloyl-ACP methyl ester carboxylesterase
VLHVTVVLVHGNPETAAIWAPLIDELGRTDVGPVLALSPPGFGAPVPPGFGATSDEYVAWLAAELEPIGEPVDLVGHDWGSNHVVRLACERPDLVRSWCGDTAGVFAPGFEWNKSSQIWMTPGAGEEAIAWQLSAGVPGRTALYESLGMTTEIAQELAVAFDEAMGQCILNVYRSALPPAWDIWRERLPAAAQQPGLVIVPTADIYTGSEAQHRWTATRSGADVAVLDGLGHWWMLDQPGLAAQTLLQFWAN